MEISATGAFRLLALGTLWGVVQIDQQRYDGGRVVPVFTLP
jgi:hypothetical protein